MKELLVICDGDASSGCGHVNRCLAIAEFAMEHGWLARFMGEFSDSAEKMIRSSGATVELNDFAPDAPGSTRRIEECLPKSMHSAILLDSYRIGDSFINELFSLRGGRRLIVIDDMAMHSSYLCDVILNFTMRARCLKYPETNAETMFGLEYFPARSWLYELRAEIAPPRNVRGHHLRVAVTLGGSDLRGDTLRVVEALAEEDNVEEITVVIDSFHKDNPEIDAVLEGFRGRVRKFPLLDTLRPVFESCDLVICSGGLTKYEAVFLGLPTGVLDQTDVQREDTAHFVAENLVIDLGGQLKEKLHQLVTQRNLLEGLTLRASRYFSRPSRQAMERILAI